MSPHTNASRLAGAAVGQRAQSNRAEAGACRALGYAVVTAPAMCCAIGEGGASPMGVRMEKTLGTSPTRVAAVLVRRWWVIVGAAAIAAGLAFGWGLLQKPVFHSTASLYFSMRSAVSGSDINQGSTYTQNQMLSFAQLAESSLVLGGLTGKIPGDPSVQEIRRSISVSIPQNTVILSITAGDGNPERAAVMANAVAGRLADVVEDVAPKDDSNAATVVARVVDPATPAVYQTTPNKQRDAVLGAIIGALAAALAITIWALVDTRVRNEQVLRQATDLPLIGSIPRRKAGAPDAVVVAEPNGRAAEAYRGVRSNLRYSAVGHDIRIVAITSATPGEGKTTTAINLALAYAEAGHDVILVDADLRRPMVSSRLGLEGAVGLTSILVDGATIDDVSLGWGPSKLRVVPAGEVPPNPAELLASQRMSDTLRELADGCDTLIVDTAPLLSVADATLIAPVADVTLLVVDASSLRTRQLERALGVLEGVNATMAGVILNRVRSDPSDGYTAYYGSASK